LQYISSAARVGKERELISLEQGDMTVEAYAAKFSSLCQFTGDLYQTEDRRARMFEKGLRFEIREHVVSLRCPTLREVVDAAIAQEVERPVAQEGKDGASGSAGQAGDKKKGKRPFAQTVQQGARQGEPHAGVGQQAFRGKC
jgi:hypothetical protein